MKLISHNSWTFTTPKKWWMKVINFTAKCQSKTIKEQFDSGIRAFDLRIRFDKNKQLQVVHGYIVYDISNKELFKDLQYINDNGSAVVRILHDVRNYNQYKTSPVEEFAKYCQYYETMFPNITFFGGNNLFNNNIDYNFKIWFSIEGKYGSAIKPTWLYGWYPRLYAWFNNRFNINEGTDKDYLMLDFIEYN